MTDIESASTSGPWPKEFPELKELDTLLKCGICYEYMQTTLISACSHSFCSLCIRKYLQYQTQCPTCFSSLYDNQLRNNRTVDAVVQVYIKVKDKLCHHLRISAVYIPSTPSTSQQDTSVNKTPKQVEPKKLEVKAISHTQENNASSTKKTPKLNAEKKLFTNLLEKKEKVKDWDFIEVLESSEDVQPPSLSPLPSQSTKPDVYNSSQISFTSPTVSKIRVPNMFTISPKPKPEGSTRALVLSKTVPCPVCSVDIPESNINLHLDKCLERASGAHLPSPPAENKNKMKRLPKLVYTLLSDKDLKKKAKEYGLSVLGDRKALISRLKRYAVIYNSELDKSSPRSVLEILQQVEKEEKVEQKANSVAERPVTIFNNITRNTDQKVINEANEKYLQDNKQTFELLIQKMKERDGQNIKPTGHVNRIFSDEDSNSSTELSKNLVVDTTPKTNGLLRSLDDYIEDNDSDSSIIESSPVLGRNNAHLTSNASHPSEEPLFTDSAMRNGAISPVESLNISNDSVASVSMLAECQLDFDSGNDPSFESEESKVPHDPIDLPPDENSGKSEEIFVTQKQKNKRKATHSAPASPVMNLSPRKLRKRAKK